MNPKYAQTLYIAGAIVGGLLSLVSIWKGVDTGTAQVNVDRLINGIIAFIPGGASAVGAIRVGKQIKGGHFDEKSPLDQMKTGLQKITQDAADKAADLNEATKFITNTGIAMLPPVLAEVRSGVSDAKDFVEELRASVAGKP